MTLTITLSPIEEARLQEKSAALSQPMDALAGDLLSERLRNDEVQSAYNPAEALAVLDSFLEQDEKEHQETLVILRTALDEDRPGQRSVFGAGMNLPAAKTP